ncbi:MAG TPA: response regulator [Planctomycetota bacterium]|nr:response regulator [Planctomycetota bacterium]
MTPLRAILVEDSPDDLALLVRELSRGYAIEYETVQTREALAATLESGPWDVVFTDYNLPQLNGLQVIELLKAKRPDMPVVVVSGTIGEERAVELLKSGAVDYVMKDNLARLLSAVERALRERDEHRKRSETEAALRKAEEQMRQLQKLEAIGNLAGGVAHDFNNLLMIILGYTDLLMGKVGDPSPLRSELEQIRKAGERGANLTRQLLAFSRRQVLQPRSLDLNALVSDTHKMIRRLIPKTIEVVLRLDPNLKRIKADPGQIEQVLMNLVINAKDAMRDGVGRITIETANTVLTSDFTATHISARPGPHSMLSVSDTGTGMDAKTQQRIFEPFFTTKELGRGTGLGLSTVYGIVKQNNGTIWVYSEVGLGSTFKIYLPHAEVAAPSGEMQAVLPPPPAGRGSILLVEDEPQVRELVTAILSGSGFTVHAAADAEAALSLARTHAASIRLVITEMALPRISGHSLAKQLRPLMPHAKVLFTSGYSANTIQQQISENDGDEFLQKPFVSKVLLQKVHALMDKGNPP